MRKISANYIFTGSSSPLKNGIISLDDSGKILDIKDTGGNLRETAKLAFYNGIIVPGFVNTHCHLELSHLKGFITKYTGLAEFILKLSKNRVDSTEKIRSSAKLAEEEMFKNGIVAVGDISNTADCFEIKAKQKIHYHTFLEIFGLDPDKANDVIAKAIKLAAKLKKENKLTFSIVPHAPYSVSPSLYMKISKLPNNKPLSIHNQESAGEQSLFNGEKGPLYEALTTMVPDYKKWCPSAKSPLKYTLDQLKSVQKILLVHNTYTSESDLSYSEQTNAEKYWVLCPNANQYIENKLPDISLFRSKKLKIALGTDSLASNNQLSILEEMKTISQIYKEIPLEELISWATVNGARALNISDRFGQIEPGMTPGLNLLYDLNLSELKLTRESKVKRLA